MAALTQNLEEELELLTGLYDKVRECKVGGGVVVVIVVGGDVKGGDTDVTGR